MVGSRRTMGRAHANWVDHLSLWHLDLYTDHVDERFECFLFSSLPLRQLYQDATAVKRQLRTGWAYLRRDVH